MTDSVIKKQKYFFYWTPCIEAHKRNMTINRIVKSAVKMSHMKRNLM